MLAYSPVIAQVPPSGGGGPDQVRAYEDQLIDPDIQPDPAPDELRIEDPGLPWVAGASYRLGYRDDDTGDLTEHALAGSYQRDTANWGRFQFDALVRTSDGNGLFGKRGEDGHFTATQTGLPLGGGWLADNGLGVQRSVSDPLLEASYRIYLPASVINGVTTRVGDDNDAWRFTWGEVGRVEGLYSRTFEPENATVAGGGYSRELNDNWRFAAEFWQAQPDDGETSRSYATALEFHEPEDERSDQIHALYDDDGDGGIWYDGLRRDGRWAHHFGAFSLGPGLEWQNATIVNDRNGAYYRADYRTLSTDYNVGVDTARNRTSESVDYRAFGGGLWRLGVSQSFGTQVSLGGLDPGDTPESALLAGTRSDWQVSAFYNHGLDWADHRIEIQTSGFDRGDEDQRTHRLSLDQFWLGSTLEGLSTRLELERREEGGVSLDRVLAGLSYRHRFTGGLSVDAGLLAVRQDVTPELAESGGNATFNVNWPFHDNWTLSLNAMYTRSAGEDPLVPAGAATMDDNQVFLTLSWGDAGGRLPGVLGRGSAERGIGRITGYVFYDDNRDGRRSPGEEGVEGAVVRLDGVVTAITDARGRFEYWPVAAGAHRLAVSPESLPLPWESAGAATVTVQPRGENYSDVPVRRIDE